MLFDLIDVNLSESFVITETLIGVSFGYNCWLSVSAEGVAKKRIMKKYIMFVLICVICQIENFHLRLLIAPGGYSVTFNTGVHANIWGPKT